MVMREGESAPEIARDHPEVDLHSSHGVDHNTRCLQFINASIIATTIVITGSRVQRTRNLTGSTSKYVSSLASVGVDNPSIDSATTRGADRKCASDMKMRTPPG
jgi:hypothetical protein